MKKIMIATAFAAAAFATPALAGTIQAEARFGDVRGGSKPDSTEYRVEYAAPLNGGINYGAEVQVKQKNGAGDLTAKISAKVGPRLPDVLGFKSQAYGEIGQSLTRGDDYLFWGAGVKTSHVVSGPLTVNAGYRHRESFNATGRLTENRLNGGLGLDIGSGNVVGVNYYRTTGTTREDAIGVGVTHSF